VCVCVSVSVSVSVCYNAPTELTRLYLPVLNVKTERQPAR
jgi:hypothetical protein